MGGAAGSSDLIWCNDGKNEFYAYKNIPNNCVRGRLLNLTEESRHKLATAKNCHWYHDKYTLQNKMFSSDEEIPDNYIIGKIQNCSSNITGKHLYSNDAGEMHYYFDDEFIPDGFYRGCTKNLNKQEE